MIDYEKDYITINMTIIMISNLYDVFNKFSYDEVEYLKNNEKFMQSVSKEIADELRTIKAVYDSEFEIKTIFTNYAFMQVWQTKNYWVVDAGMGLGFAQYPKGDWTLQEAVDDQTVSQHE